MSGPTAKTNAVDGIVTAFPLFLARRLRIEIVLRFRSAWNLTRSTTEETRRGHGVSLHWVVVLC
jgi:hypothetical protein